MAAPMILLRNFRKFNGARFLKPTMKMPASTAPPKSYATFVKNSHFLTNLMHKAILKRCISLEGPKMAAAGGGNHAAIWTLEKILSATLLLSAPAAFMFPSQAMDMLLAVSLVLHAHWGIEAVIVDYVRPNVVGNIVPRVAHVALFAISIATLSGLFYLIHNDIGMANAIKSFWHANNGADKPPPPPTPPVKEKCV